MSEFEFISVLISMVVGLGVTHVLRGFAQVVHERKQAPVDGVHMVWTAVVTLSLPLLPISPGAAKRAGGSSSDGPRKLLSGRTRAKLLNFRSKV